MTIMLDEWRHGSAAVLKVTGRLDSRNALVLETRLSGLEAEPVAAVVIDLAGVDYITGTCLRLLVLTARRMDEVGRRLALCAPQEHVRDVLHISGLTRALHIHADPSTALAELNRLGKTG
jgi:anti-anti-sigma factor